MRGNVKEQHVLFKGCSGTLTAVVGEFYTERNVYLNVVTMFLLNTGRPASCPRYCQHSKCSLTWQLVNYAPSCCDGVAQPQLL